WRVFSPDQSTNAELVTRASFVLHCHTIQLGGAASPSAGAADAAASIGGLCDGAGGPGERCVAMQDDLRDTLTVFDADALRGNIAHHHEPFIGIVGIDGAGCVGQNEAAAKRDRAPQANLRLVSGRQSRTEAQWNECDVAGLER